jgi:hypothetical protein
MAEFVTEPAQQQERDTVGLALGIVFALLGLTYLIGGNDAVGDNWGVLLPAVLVLLGVAGLASSGLVPRRGAAPAEATTESTPAATAGEPVADDRTEPGSPV